MRCWGRGSSGILGDVQDPDTDCAEQHLSDKNANIVRCWLLARQSGRSCFKAAKTFLLFPLINKTVWF